MTAALRNRWTGAVTAIAASSVIQQGLALVLMVTLTRRLGATGYGQVAIAVAAGTTLYNWVLYWTAPSMVRDVSVLAGRGDEAKRLYLGLSFIQALVVAVVIAAGWIVQESGISLPAPFDSLLWMAPFAGLAFMQLARNGFQAFTHFRALALGGIAEKVLQLAAVWILVVGSALHAVSAVLAMAISSIAIALFAVGALVKETNMRPQLAHAARAMFAAWKLFFTTVLGYFASHPFLLLLTGYLFGEAAAAAVGVGVTMTGFVMQPLFWVLPTLLPHFSTAARVGESESERRYLRLALAVPLAVAVCFVTALDAVLSSPWNPLRHLGPGFESGATPVAILLLSAIPEGVHAALNPLLIARHREGMILAGAAARVVAFLAAAAFARSAVQLAAVYTVFSWVTVGVDLLATWSRTTTSALAGLLLAAVTSIAITLALLATPVAGFVLASATCLVAGLLALRGRNTLLAALRGQGG